MPQRFTGASFFGLIFAAVLAGGACDDGDNSPPAPRATREQLLDPATCGQCHRTQYEEWQSSMHAYASDDPIFVAMNQRGQREAGI